MLKAIKEEKIQSYHDFPDGLFWHFRANGGKTKVPRRCYCLCNQHHNCLVNWNPYLSTNEKRRTTRISRNNQSGRKQQWVIAKEPRIVADKLGNCCLRSPSISTQLAFQVKPKTFHDTSLKNIISSTAGLKLMKLYSWE